MASVAFTDAWGEVIQRPEHDTIEIRWFDSTAAMSGDEFNDWLSRFATEVERAATSRVLVDGLAFAMPNDRMDSAWRDANIIPRYNAAGVNRFAFLMPEGMPAIGVPPRAEGPANYLTAYFGTRRSAMEWLTG
jgi:hypothetical protein